MKCTVCGSDNTQRLQVIFEQGTSNIDTTSGSVGLGLSSGIGLGGAHTRTTGTSQSTTAAKAAPPAKKKWGWSAFFAVVGVFITFQSESPVFGLCVLGVFGTVAALALRFNNNEWPKLYERWRTSWYCNKCGNVYVDDLSQARVTG